MAEIYGDVLRDFVIRVLARRPGLTARQILDDCLKNKIATSQSGLYKELRRMCDAGVLFKEGVAFRLHLNWVLETVEFASVLEKTYLDGSPFLAELPPVGKRVRWHLTNFYRLNDLFTNVVLRLVQQTSLHLHLSWNPHPWLHLVQTRQEEIFFKALKKYRVRMYKIVGSSTPLSRWAEQFWDPEMVTWSYGRSPFHKLPHLYFSVVDDYIVTVELNGRTVRKLDALYEGSRSGRQGRKGREASALVDPKQLASLFEDRTKAVLTLSHNPRKAASIRRKYERYFGPLVSGTRELPV